ncbi:MAG TPA: hypothetical protein PLU50_00840 [Pseudobdellovibrionaceae bacterium]|nr:hypothetical protein [Pseudobdellovibrionaceae bacterium]
MRKSIFVYLSILFIFSQYTYSRPQIDFEDSIYAAEGSMWGAEGSLQKALEIDDHELPMLYQQVPEAHPILRKLTDVNQGLLMDGTARLYGKLELCIDPQLANTSDLASLNAVMTDFQREISGYDSTGRGLKIILRLQAVDSLAPNHCDILFVRGSWLSFPFKQLREVHQSVARSPDWRGQIFGIFYQKSTESLPVIVVNPDVALQFQGTQAYVEMKNSRIVLDGSSLIMHELGHVLGFAHLHRGDGNFLYPELTTMGLDNGERLQENIERRFQSPTRVGRNWDLRQTNLYRKHLWLNSSELFFEQRSPKMSSSAAIPVELPSVCLIPGQEMRVSLPIISKQQNTKQLFQLPEVIEQPLFVLDPKALTPFDFIFRGTVSTFHPLPFVQIALNQSEEILRYFEISKLEFIRVRPAEMQISLVLTAVRPSQKDIVLGTSLTIYHDSQDAEGQSYMDLQLRKLNVRKDPVECS